MILDVKINYPAVYMIGFFGNHKLYIGSGASFHNRQMDHLRKLKNQIHYNKFLQGSFNKYGLNNLRIYPIEIYREITTVELRKREKWWIDYLRTNKNKYGYNLIPDPTYQDETRKWTREDRRKFEKNRNLYLKIYKFYNPKGELVEIKDLRNFCLHHRLNYDSMISLEMCRINTYQGWKKDINKKSLKFKEFVFISPSRESVYITNLRKFCKENDLSYTAMHDLTRNKGVQHKQWKYFKDKRNQRTERKYIFLSPEGKEITTFGLKDFALKFNLNLNSVRCLASGASKKIKGWTLLERGI